MTSRSPALSARERTLLVVLCGALFLDGLDVSMAQVALPAIGRDLDVAPSSLQWVVSSYVIGFGGFLLVGGRAADLVGRRNVFLWSLAAFVVASAAGVPTSDPALLVVTRLFKGIAAAFTAPAGLSLVTTSFAAGSARNRALATYTATGASGFSLGLVGGGALTQLSWRLAFGLPAVVGALLLAASRRAVPADAAPADAAPASAGGRFELVGAVLITSASVLAVLALSSAPDAGWASLRTLVTAAAASARSSRSSWSSAE